MPRPRSSYRDQLPPYEQQGEILYQCPFKGFDGCRNRVGGRGLDKSSILKHQTTVIFLGKVEQCVEMKSRTFLGFMMHGKQMWICEECMNLTQLQMLIYGEWMNLHAWNRSCISREGNIILGSFNERGYINLSLLTPSAPWLVMLQMLQKYNQALLQTF